MGVVKVLINLVVLVLIVAAGFFAYNYYQQNNTFLTFLPKFQPQYQLADINNETTQFVPNLRFANSQISYFINDNCGKEQKSRLEQAMQIISNDVSALSFYIANEMSADILMGCSKNSYEQEKNVFTAGEGGPTAYLNLSYYPLIKRGKVLLYEKSDCAYPIVEIHELLHVFGFEHINNKSDIMFPYAICGARISQKTIDVLEKLYTIKPLAELAFANANATLSSKYLNLEIEVTNQGLIDAENVNVNLYADSIMLDPIEVGKVEVGQTQIIRIKNIALPSRTTKTIDLIIDYQENEFEESNNALKLTLN